MPDSPAILRWSLLHWVEEVWEAVLEDCAAAENSIDFEQYILTPDTIGQRVLGLFAEKAQAGVRVRVLVDAFGSASLKNSPPARDLEEAGGRLEFYNRPMLRQLLHLPPRIHRDHRKTVLLDGSRAWAGGVCFTDRMADWRDTMVRFDGAVVAQAVRFFETSWARAEAQQTYRAQRRAPPEVVPPEDAGAFRYLVNSPERPASRALYKALRAQVRGARRSIGLTTPYFVPEHRFLRDLFAALQRGVALDLVLPAESDHPPLDILSHAFAERLARRGARVHYFEPAMIHAKLAVIDDAWASVGSLNLDRLSFRTNLENALVSADPDFIGCIAARLEADIALSTRTCPERPRWSVVADPLLAMAGRLL